MVGLGWRVRRGVLAAAVVATVVVGVPGGGAAAATTLVVDTTADLVDPSPGDGVCGAGPGTCSLRAAVQEANALAGADTVVLGGGTHVLTRPGRQEDAGATGDLDVTGVLTIEGNGAVVDADGLDRVFDVHPGGSFTLRDTTVTGGNPWFEYLDHSVGTVFDSTGGGIQGQSAALVLDGVTVTGNRLGCPPDESPCVRAGALQGGGILLDSGSLVLTDSAVTANTVDASAESDNPYAYFGGAGVSAGQAAVTLTSVLVQGNTFTGVTLPFIPARQAEGGGLAIGYPTSLLLDHVSLLDNGGPLGPGPVLTDTAGAGGGMLVAVTKTTGTLTVRDSVIAGNDAWAGGGILVAGYDWFGPPSPGPTLELERTTVADNTAHTAAIAVIDGEIDVVLRDSTVSGNVLPDGFDPSPEQPMTGLLTWSTGTVQVLRSTLVGDGVVLSAEGPATVGGSVLDVTGAAPACAGGGWATPGPIVATSLGGNVVSDVSCGLGGAGDLEGVDPQLGPLGDHGGPSPTHRPEPTSPVIDLVPLGDPLCAGTDQRGVSRPQRAGCDAGAVELAPVTASVGAAAMVEGDDGGRRTLHVPVTLSEPLAAEASVDFAVSGGTATPGVDLIAKTGTVRFRPNAKGLTPTVRWVAVPVLPDTEVEGDETLTVTLANPTGGLVIAHAAATGVIVDDDPGAGPTVDVGDVSLWEGDRSTSASGNRARVRVTLRSPAVTPVTVLVTVTPGSATPGVDYRVPKPRVVTFQPGQRHKSVSVPVTADESAETDETILVTLSDPTGGVTLGKATGLITILDDD